MSTPDHQEKKKKIISFAMTLFMEENWKVGKYSSMELSPIFHET